MALEHRDGGTVPRPAPAPLFRSQGKTRCQRPSLRRRRRPLLQRLHHRRPLRVYTPPGLQRRSSEWRASVMSRPSPAKSNATAPFLRLMGQNGDQEEGP